MAQLLSVNVGLPRDIQWRGETVHTGIWKESVQGRRMVRRLNIDGDGQGDLAGHGGEQRAVMVYQIDSYHYWEHVLGRNDFSLGQLGENLTVEGLADDEVCIGERYRIGGALFEVTQPRVTCYRVGIRMNEPTMAALLVSHRRPGFYLRVLEEGEIGAGDEICKVSEGPERMSVADIDALLYLPGHPRDQLQRSLRIPALSPGWKASLQALLNQEISGTAGEGNPGLTTAAGLPPAWTGFRSLRVTRVDRESADVRSVWLAVADKSALSAALPGQFLVLRMQPGLGLPRIVRNYSISSAPGSAAYRISVKRQENGLAGKFLHEQLAVGDELEVSAPRGHFTLQPGNRAVVLLGAGVGATPLLAMLHALVAESSPREVWWLYGARNRADHPFAEESRELVQALPRGRAYVVYSRPAHEDRLGADYDESGHLTVSLLDQLRIPRSADFYLCGPAAFLRDFGAGLKEWGADSDRIHVEFFASQGSLMPGIAARQRAPAHVPEGPAGTGAQVTFTRSGISVPWSDRFHSLLELAEACDVPVKWSCRSGVCHTCECALIGGAVVFQPHPLESASEGNVLICCARPATEVEIDL